MSPNASSDAVINTSMVMGHQQDIISNKKDEGDNTVVNFFKDRQCKEAENPGAWVTIDVVPRSQKYESSETVKVKVPEHFLEYGLRPKHNGPKVIYLDAENPAFYDQTLSNPSTVVWCLSGKQNMSGYVKRRLWEAAYARNIDFKVKATSEFELLASTGGLEEIIYAGEKVDLPDIVLSRTGAVGADYFSLALLRQLEQRGVTIINGVDSTEITRDKLKTMQVMAAHGLPIPKTLLAKFPMNMNVVNQEFSYPIIVKKCSGSQGNGVILVDSSEQLEDIMDLLDQKEPLIFQEFEKDSRGRDLRVFVVGGRIVGCMQRVAQKGFKANVHQGASVHNFKLTSQIEWLVLEAVNLTGLDVAGVDLLFGKDTVKICEINSSPGFDGLEEATGIDIASSILNYVKIRTGVWRIPQLGKSAKKVMKFPDTAED